MIESANRGSGQGTNPEQEERAVFFRVNALWLLLLLYLVGSCFVPAGIISTSMLAFVVFFLVDPYAKQRSPLFPGIGFFILIVLAGVMGSAGKAPYDVAKDVWYVGNPALTILFGYLMVKRMDGLLSILRAFVVAAIIVSIVHVFRFILNPSYFNESLSDIRDQVSTGYLITAVGIGIVVGDLRYRLGVLPTRLASWSVMVLCLLSVTLSFSRTLWVSVLTVAFAALIIDNLRVALRIATVTVVVIIITIAATGLYQSGIETDTNFTFFEKIIYSLRELQVSEYTEISDINRNWRGFETYRALQTYASGSPTSYLFGKGFGTNVDLGFTITLADVEFDRIPILHNGYMYLLVKTGAMGLATYLLYLLLTLRTGMQLSRLHEAEARICGFLLVALTLIILETTLVISGMFNKSWVYPATLFLGMLMGYAESILSKVYDRRAIIASTLRDGCCLSGGREGTQ